MTPFFTAKPARSSKQGHVKTFIMKDFLPDDDDVLKKVAEALKLILKQPGEDEGGYYDNADLVRMLNVCPRTLYRWRQQKLVKFVKMRGKFFYPKSAIRNLTTRSRRKK